MASLGVNVNVPCCMLPRPIGMFRRGYPAPGSLCPSIRDGCRRVVDTSKSMGPGAADQGEGIASPEAGESIQPIEPAEPSEGDQNALGTLKSLKKFSWISFWIQLALSLASAGVLLFTITTAQKGNLSSFFLSLGVATSLISTVLVRMILIKARTISKEENPEANLMKWDVESLLLRNTDINLVGLASSIIALQGEIGLLVAKTLSSSSLNPYTAQQSGPAAIDVFAVQGAANVLLAHFCSIMAVTFLLRAIQRFNKRVAKAAASTISSALS